MIPIVQDSYILVELSARKGTSLDNKSKQISDDADLHIGGGEYIRGKKIYSRSGKMEKNIFALRGKCKKIFLPALRENGKKNIYTYIRTQEKIYLQCRFCTHVKTKTKTECLKHSKCTIFLESRRSRISNIIF